jgi:hypothetical protein
VAIGLALTVGRRLAIPAAGSLLMLSSSRHASGEDVRTPRSQPWSTPLYGGAITVTPGK